METHATLDQLHQPLLGILSDEVDDVHLIPDDATIEHDEEQEEPTPWMCCIDMSLTWIVLPLMLGLQFHLAFFNHLTGTHNLSYTVVGVSIALYVVTASVYRSTCLERNWRCLSLAPEVGMDVILLLIFVDRTPAAFVVLLATKLVLATVVLWHCLYNLWSQEEDDDDDERMEVCVV